MLIAVTLLHSMLLCTCAATVAVTGVAQVFRIRTINWVDDRRALAKTVFHSATGALTTVQSQHMSLPRPHFAQLKSCIEFVMVKLPKLRLSELSPIKLTGSLALRLLVHKTGRAQAPAIFLLISSGPHQVNDLEAIQSWWCPSKYA